MFRIRGSAFNNRQILLRGFSRRNPADRQDGLLINLYQESTGEILSPLSTVSKFSSFGVGLNTWEVIRDCCTKLGWTWRNSKVSGFMPTPRWVQEAFGLTFANLRDQPKQSSMPSLYHHRDSTHETLPRDLLDESLNSPPKKKTSTQLAHCLPLWGINKVTPRHRYKIGK